MSLSTRQRHLIEYMIANPLLPERTCAAQAGIPESTYFRWKKNEEFIAELDKKIKEKWKDSERLATDTMISLVREGNFNATKYILDNLGYKPEDKVAATVDQNIVITVSET